MASSMSAPYMAQVGSVAKVHVAGPESIVQSMLTELFWFVAGAIVVRILMFLGFIPEWNGPGIFGFIAGIREEWAATRRCAIKQLCASTSAGLYKAALKVWDQEKSRGTFPVDALEDVTQSLASETPERLVPDLVEHFARFPKDYAQPSTMNALLEIVVQSKVPGSAQLLQDALQQRVEIIADDRTQSILARLESKVMT